MPPEVSCVAHSEKPTSCVILCVRRRLCRFDLVAEPVPEKRCTKCHKLKPLTVEFFSRNQSTNTGGNKYWRPECKDCQRRITRDKNTARRNAGSPPTPPLGNPCHNCGRTDQKLCFDHCHKTLRHRGWLCDNCNRALGMLGDTIEDLERMIRYLRHGSQHS